LPPQLNNLPRQFIYFQEQPLQLFLIFVQMGPRECIEHRDELLHHLLQKELRFFDLLRFILQDSFVFFEEFLFV
jgi:hypothetical protein